MSASAAVGTIGHRVKSVDVILRVAVVLLAFAKAKAQPVVCIAHIAIGKGEGDSAKGRLRRETALLLVAEFARRLAGLSNSPIARAQ